MSRGTVGGHVRTYSAFWYVRELKILECENQIMEAGFRTTSELWAGISLEKTGRVVRKQIVGTNDQKYCDSLIRRV